MVRLRKDNKIRVSDDFLNFTSLLRDELRTPRGRQPTSREITDNIVGFLHRENLTPILIRQAKKKKRGRFF